MKPRLKTRLLAGLTVWSLYTIYLSPHPLSYSWGNSLVAFAPLFIIPLTVRLLVNYKAHFTGLRRIEPWILPAALFWLAASLMPPGIQAFMLALPWAGIALFISYEGCRIIIRPDRTVASIGISSGMILLSIGAAWALTDRLGIRPLGFSQEIIFLTVAHFHYAGFVLPVVAGLTCALTKRIWDKVAVTGIITGVPLVAMALINSQLRGAAWIESAAVFWLAASAILLAASHFGLACRKGFRPIIRIAWFLAAGSLFAGMVLAGLYGVRHTLPVAWLNIAWMRVVHGTANVFGFGLFALTGWYFRIRIYARRSSTAREKSASR